MLYGIWLRLIYRSHNQSQLLADAFVIHTEEVSLSPTLQSSLRTLHFRKYDMVFVKWRVNLLLRWW